MSSQEFTVVGVFVKQGTFLGLFSFDDQVVLPLTAFKKYFAKKGTDSDVRVKVADKTRMDEAKAELIADVRGETSQDAAEARAEALPKGKPAGDPASEPETLERARLDFLDSAFSDALAIYMLSLAVDFDYAELREREYPLLAPAALAARLRLMSTLFPPNDGYEFSIRYRRR